jgi:hypothetical protein
MQVQFCLSLRNLPCVDKELALRSGIPAPETAG